MYVEKAVHSILSQSYKNLEIWIIDDASTDDTLQKINAIKDNRIRVISFNENTQKVGAVNEVLQKVNGEFIAFQDADDWSESERIQQQVDEFMKDSKLGVCFTNYRYLNSKIYLPDRIALTDKELKGEFLNYTMDKDKNYSPTVCGTMMISKAVLNKTKGYHPYFIGRVGEDIHWIYRILMDFNGITVDNCLYNYRIRRKGSFTSIQFLGIKPKYAYSWQLLSKIIYKNVHEGINVLTSENKGLLSQLELEACEDALVEKIQLLNKTISIYENSTSFKVGKLLLTPWRLLKSLKGNRIS